MGHILITDYDRDVRDTLHILLGDAGYTTFTAQNGHQVLTFIHQHPAPLVVLLEIGLPDIDGLSILRKVADQDEPLPPHKRAYILVTGHAPALYMPYSALLAQLQVPVLPKPFDIDYLLALVSQAERHVTTR